MGNRKKNFPFPEFVVEYIVRFFVGRTKCAFEP